MLKMTRSVTRGTQALLLEGKLVEPWVEALRAELTGPGRRVRRLDLSGLTYVDLCGAALLRALEREGIALCGASAFVQGLLDLPSARG